MPLFLFSFNLCAFGLNPSLLVFLFTGTDSRSRNIHISAYFCMMASSSHTKYDVFISFRGTDVRSGLLSHLKVSLKQHKIDFYVDEDKLEKGDEISPSLLTAIDESLMSLVIFSKDYASSKWCLEELVKIMECKQTVIPVFYNTDPSHVRHQIGSYKDAFTKHEERCAEKVQVWRSALKTAADLSGFHSSNYKDEAELIEQITKSLFKRLNTLMCPSTLRNLVGIEKKIEDLLSLMQQNSQDVCVIGLWGMGGIGKTTLATAVFYRFRYEYEGSCFLENVREVSQRHGGVIDLKNKLFSSLLKEKDLQIDTSNGLPPNVERKLRRTKVLIVLDDISDLSQIENLVGELNCYGLGSRIIITTRDKDMLKNEAIKTYEVMPLTSEEALELFNLNAFGENCKATEFHGLSSKVIEYTRELPLAVKVLGSFLRGKNKQEWESQLDKLKKRPFKKIQDVLKLSYDNLDRQQKNVFLYIACCFKGYKESYIMNILDKCDFSIAIELKVLRDKALITCTSEEESIVSMHDLLEEMGKDIVRKESMEDPSKQRHLWDVNDICEVLENKKGTKHIQSINIDERAFGSISCSSPGVFSRMHKLKILKLSSVNTFLYPKLELPKGLQSLPNELRLLHWDYYPLPYLPSTFCAKNLVVFRMWYSNLERLWDGAMPLENLKTFELSWSKDLVELPDLSWAKNLEEVRVDRCSSLRVVHPSIFSLPKLKELNLDECNELTSLKSDIPLKSLSHLFLPGCERLKELSVISKNMIMMDLSFTPIEKFAIPFGCFGKVERLLLEDCFSLTHLPSNFTHLTSLRFLNIMGCEQLRCIPQLPPSIEQVRAEGCKRLQFSSMDGNGMTFNKNLSSLVLVNCMKLDGHLCEAIGLAARPNLTNYARKSLKERERLQNNGFGSLESLFMFPGRKVPKWFKHRTRKGSLTFSPHSRLLGCIFCIIIPPNDYIEADCFLKNNDGVGVMSLNLHDIDDYTFNAFSHGHCGRSSAAPHVRISYGECGELVTERIEESRGKGENPKLSFKFRSRYAKQVIREFGVHPIYAKEDDEDDCHEDEDDEREEEEEVEENEAVDDDDDDDEEAEDDDDEREEEDEDDEEDEAEDDEDVDDDEDWADDLYMNYMYNVLAFSKEAKKEEDDNEEEDEYNDDDEEEEEL